jgi:hypothetical protein
MKKLVTLGVCILIFGTPYLCYSAGAAKPAAQSGQTAVSAPAATVAPPSTPTATSSPTAPSAPSSAQPVTSAPTTPCVSSPSQTSVSTSASPSSQLLRRVRRTPGHRLEWPGRLIPRVTDNTTWSDGVGDHSERRAERLERFSVRLETGSLPAAGERLNLRGERLSVLGERPKEGTFLRLGDQLNRKVERLERFGEQSEVHGLPPLGERPKRKGEESGSLGERVRNKEVTRSVVGSEYASKGPNRLGERAVAKDDPRVAERSRNKGQEVERLSGWLQHGDNSSK